MKIVKINNEGFLYPLYTEPTASFLDVEVNEDTFNMLHCCYVHYNWKYNFEKQEWKQEQIEGISQEEEKQELRSKRMSECFDIVNRGESWYRTLTENQKQELQSWYQAWLDVTTTKQIPTKPYWLK